MTRPKYELGQVIRDHYWEFFHTYRCVPEVHRTFTSLSICRTSVLGGHVEKCPKCGEIHVSYNSCRDRHCPKCQQKARVEWVEARREEVLPGVKYFHVVFTVPDCLHSLAMTHQALFYDCMFKTAWSTLKKFFDARGLKGGMSAILHTWGSNMFYHPHLHYIVPGGGTDKRGRWHGLDGCKGARDFLFPVQALSTVFRAKFIDMLARRLRETGSGFIRGDIRKQCFAKAWVVYSRPPAKGVEQVLEYIGRYAYRVAISNSRIKDYDGKKVTYDWKNYRRGGKRERMTMSAINFLHLFSLHVLPKAFVRIRHYGLLSPSNWDLLRKVQVQLGGTPVPKERKKKPYRQICEEQGWRVGLCPKCRTPMVEIGEVKPRSPPNYIYVDSAFA